ncbi:12160_t:CDS:2 [Entrophospora sp. SA101]|nr:5325_t:CDS:2 [Entrophospora sp. SA101]CAJ0754375.1 12160_t:CDS:2 [Entrophospora sp. SA101]CAJ0871151.1 4156_t:CDS:2 [Entrophospora sp. SA101]
MNSKKQQSLDNLNLPDDENLPSWIEKFKLQNGLVIDEMGIKKGNIQPIQPFSSSTNPKINNINSTDSIKTNLTITNSLLHSYLLKKSKQKVEDPLNLEFKQTIHFEISSQQIELTFENFVPSNELIKDVHKALDTENPYHELEIIFSDYGHLLCKKIILGGKLSRSQHLDLNENLFTEKTIEKSIDPSNINNNEKLDEMLKEWDEIHRKINHDFNFDNKIFFNVNGHTTKRNSVIKWIKIMAENSEFWDVIYYADLIPLYKILEESLQKGIELLFKDQILMMNLIKIEHKNKKYYRVDFKTSLKSDKYQIYGTIFNKNSEKCSDIIIVFKYFDQYGFSIIIERFDENQNDVSHIIWAMVGSPAKIGFYSKNTRNLEMMNNKESFGTDLGDIFNMSSLNNSLSRVFGNLLDDY